MGYATRRATPPCPPGTVSVILLASAAFACAACGGGGGGSDGGVVTPPAFEATISWIQNNVFTPKCALAGCHTGPNPQNGLDLSMGNAFANLVNVPSFCDPQIVRVVPGDSANSLLFQKLTNTQPAHCGEPMPKPQNPGDPWVMLPANELQAIRQWIDGDGSGGAQPQPGY